HLTDKGYRIEAVNWRFGKGEIDIVAKDGDTLVFVEVKTRTSDFFGNPEVFVNARKQAQVIKTANAYIQQQNAGCESRFDIISIVMNKNRTEIEHIEDAFYPVAGKHSL
ncbi:MAG: YraN family protein, partial [Flavobacteriales bacterium]